MNAPEPRYQVNQLTLDPRVKFDREFAAHLRPGQGTANEAVQLAQKPLDAHYLLVGRMRAGEPEYAWLIPNLTQEQTSRSAFALPVHTDWVKDAADLGEDALRLSRLRAWLRLESPANPGMFPYRLALRNDKTGLVQTDGILRAGEAFGLVIHAAEEEVARGIQRRYAYVFVVDSFGNSTLLSSSFAWPATPTSGSSRWRW